MTTLLCIAFALALAILGGAVILAFQWRDYLKAIRTTYSHTTHNLEVLS